MAKFVLNDLLKKAENNDVEAMLELAEAYKKGKDVERNINQSVYWYTRCAMLDNVVAQRNLGKAYFLGSGISQDYSKAIIWLTKATEKGDLESKNFLGICYRDGYGVLVDPPVPKPISGEVEDGQSKKIYIKDVPVSILNETVKYYDADGKLITESIVEYSGKNLKRVYERYEDFEKEWYRADSKKDFLNNLFNEGVMIDALYDKANDNIDIFDILSNMAYGEKVISKDDRIEKVKNSDFINNYNECQKSVIDELLNTYKNHDVIELENIRILEVKNFNKFGGLVPIVNLFGGKDKYLNVISNIKNALYS